MAYQLQNGGTCATYESCSTAAFKHGRTETIRPCTSQTTAFSRAITSSSCKYNHSELRAMIADCSKVHGQLTKEAAMGINIYGSPVFNIIVIFNYFQGKDLIGIYFLSNIWLSSNRYPSRPCIKIRLIRPSITIYSRHQHWVVQQSNWVDSLR